MNPDDRELIRRVLKGDEAAFTELMHRNEGHLLEAVLRLVDNVEDAQDVVQDTFIEAFKTLASFKGDTQFFTWLFRIAFNIAIHRKRALGNAKGFAVKLPERDERLALVFAALQCLPPQLAFVLFLKDVVDCKYPAIAEILQLPIGTVRGRLHRARLELRLHLETPRSDTPFIVAPQLDASLAAAAGNGDMEAFYTLMMRYARHLHDMFTALTPDPALLLIAVYQRLAAFTGELPFVTWLHQIATEVAQRKRS